MPSTLAPAGSPRSRRGATLLGALLSLAPCALVTCGETTDSLGYNDANGLVLHPVSGPASYRNAFNELLGKSDADISAKIAAAFATLFHGDPATQAIYFPMGTDQAFIQDILHKDIRTEGMGLGMVVAVELDKRDEFDRLWTYSKANLQFTSGASAGYFQSFCDFPSGAAPCTDPFGMEQFLTALLFAHDRWGATPGAIDYGLDARNLIDVMRHKEDVNGGVVDGVTDLFDTASALPLDVPDASAAGISRPSLAIPAYYEVWRQAIADPFWSRAAASARAYWQRSAHPVTGLFPTRATLDGTPVPGSNIFEPEGYRAQMNIAIDALWFGSAPWESDESDRILQFFTGQGIDRYGTAYTLDGTTCLDTARENALVAVNGMTASVSTRNDRTAYVQAVWDLVIPADDGRYYAGILDLVALLVLGGQYRIW